MKRKGKCFLVVFTDGTTIKLHAKTEAEIRHIVDKPSTIKHIRALRSLDQMKGGAVQ